jgi:DNA-3-methyladenine glycosylase I
MFLNQPFSGTVICNIILNFSYRFSGAFSRLFLKKSFEHYYVRKIPNRGDHLSSRFVTDGMKLVQFFITVTTSATLLPRRQLSFIERIMATTTRSRAGSKRSSESTSPAIQLTNKRRSVDDNDTRNETEAGGPWHLAFTKGNADYEDYMANEWGFEKRGDVALFEKLSLEGAQSGLSWLTILRKRENYRRTFHRFDPEKVASMDTSDVERIVNETGSETVVRHRGKILSVIHNAKCVLDMRSQAESSAGSQVLDDFLWSFVDHKPILNRWALRGAPSTSKESVAMSKALKKRGFKFVGPTTCYSMMQAVGMVIDHPVDTPEWKAAHERLQRREGGYQQR